MLPFTGRPLLTGPWSLVNYTDTVFTAGDQTKMDRPFPSCTTEHVHQQRQNGCFRDGIQCSNRVWICCCSLLKSWLIQCSKLSQKSCQSSCLESQIINIKLKKILKKVPGPPPKLSASGRRTGSNLEHWLIMFILHIICTRLIGRLVSQFYSSLGCFYPSVTTGRVVSSNTDLMTSSCIYIWGYQITKPCEYFMG